MSIVSYILKTTPESIIAHIAPMVKSIEAGLSERLACQIEGISYMQHQYWMAAGEALVLHTAMSDEIEEVKATITIPKIHQALYRRLENSKDPKLEAYYKYFIAISQAVARFAQGQLLDLLEIGAEEWRSRAWVLEHVMPEHYAKKEQLSVTTSSEASDVRLVEVVRSNDSGTEK